MALRENLVRAYRQTLAGLLPHGIAWRKDPEANLQKLVRAYAVELALFDERARVLLAESDPRQALELLDEWERYLGLPSPCTGPLGNLGARRGALVAKFTREPSASPAYLAAFAERLGYLVDVLEFRSFRVGTSRSGMRLSNVQNGFRAGRSRAGHRLENSIAWAFAWAVRSNGASTGYFRAGASVAGDRLRTVGNTLLECSLREITPAHTELLFFYFFTIDPNPVATVLVAPDPSVG